MLAGFKVAMMFKMGLDGNTSSIENKAMFIQSIEDILEKAKTHPAIDTVALVKARNAVHRSLVQELMIYNVAADRCQSTPVTCHPTTFELKFKPMPLPTISPETSSLK